MISGKWLFESLDSGYKISKYRCHISLPLHYIKYIKGRGNVKESSPGDHESNDQIDPINQSDILLANYSILLWIHGCLSPVLL